MVTEDTPFETYRHGVGTITAANTVTVRSRVDGQLMALHFQEGQQVKAGDLLAEIGGNDAGLWQYTKHDGAAFVRRDTGNHFRLNHN